MATGVFSTARTGHNLRSRKNTRTQKQPIERFADLLAEHNLATGDLGGSVIVVSTRMGISPKVGNAMLQRMRRDLRSWGGKPE